MKNSKEKELTSASSLKKLDDECSTLKIECDKKDEELNELRKCKNELVGN